MRTFFRIIGLITVVDALWLATERKNWSSFWGGVLHEVGGRPELARAMAGLRLGMGLLFLLRPPAMLPRHKESTI